MKCVMSWPVPLTMAVTAAYGWMDGVWVCLCCMYVGVLFLLFLGQYAIHMYFHVYTCRCVHAHCMHTTVLSWVHKRPEGARRSTQLLRDFRLSIWDFSLLVFLPILGTACTILYGFRVHVKLIWLDVICWVSCSTCDRFSMELEPLQCKARQLGKRQVRYHCAILVFGICSTFRSCN